MLIACLEVLLAVLAAIGLMAVGWLAFGRLILPLGNEEARTFAVVEARGDGGGLEQTVHGLLWLRRGDLWRYRIIIVDCGLEERGQKIARYLSRDHDQVVVCNREDLARLLADRPSGAET